MLFWIGIGIIWLGGSLLVALPLCKAMKGN